MPRERGPSDQRMVFKYRNGTGDEIEGRERSGRIALQQKLGQTFKIRPRPFRIDYLRHCFSLGRVALPPRSLAR